MQGVESNNWKGERKGRREKARETTEAREMKAARCCGKEKANRLWKSEGEEREGHGERNMKTARMN